MKKIIVTLLILVFTLMLKGQIIADHTSIDLTEIPSEWLDQAKQDLHIAYGHTSHGSQVTSGMTGLVNFTGGCGGEQFSWNNGGSNGALDLHDYAMGGDCGYYPQWVDNTRNYLGNPDPETGMGTSHPDVNVIMWSWCGQISGYSEQDLIEKYINPMVQLEADYPNVKFVYMTGHLNYWEKENTNARNQQLRDFCQENGKILFDFADIESHDPDGNYYPHANDNCDYYNESGTLLGNWATEWQDSHTEGVDWFECSSAHSEPLNANMKAYAAWHLWARLAGWNGNLEPSPGIVQFNSSSVQASEGAGHVDIFVNRSIGNVGTATVEYTLDNGGTAIEDQDFSFSAGTLNWEDQESGLKSFQITITQDDNIEDEESIILKLENVSGAELGNQVTITLTILDDELTSVEYQIENGDDDVEEGASGNVNFTSSDLEMTMDSEQQIVGLRFNDIQIPKGANIYNAYLQFTVDEATTEETNLIIKAEDVDNAPGFEQVTNNVSSRVFTDNEIAWNVPVWDNIGMHADDQQTPNLREIVQEVINRPGWNLGNSLVFIISGSGKRVADSYNGAASLAAKLIIEYSETSSFIKEIIPKKTISLQGNYPNPFNPQTTIKFSLQKRSDVNLKVFNSQGKEVFRKSLQNLPMGNNSFNFDGRNFNSGLYFYQLQTDEVPIGNKMLLIK